jgi:hypothetical protein
VDTAHDTPTVVEHPADATDESELLLRYVRERDVACPLCGYNVRGLTSTRCPECGRELRLTLGLLEPYQAAWVALVGILCASGGFGLFCIFMVVKQGWPSWGDEQKLLDLTFAFHMIVPPFALAAVLMRRKFLRLRRTTQWTIFGVATAVCVLMFTGFMAYVT